MNTFIFYSVFFMNHTVFPFSSRFLACCAIFRGPHKLYDVDTEILELQNKSYSPFVEWIANNIMSVVCNTPIKSQKLSYMFISNTMAFNYYFKEIISNFDIVFKKKAGIHKFIEEGMSEDDFVNAKSKIDNLINDYQKYESAVVEDNKEQE